MKQPNIKSILEELENLTCINGAMYFGSVEEPCSGRETGECCHNEQTYEEALTELKHFLTQKLQQAMEVIKPDSKQLTYRMCYNEDERVYGWNQYREKINQNITKFFKE